MHTRMHMHITAAHLHAHTHIFLSTFLHWPAPHAVDEVHLTSFLIPVMLTWGLSSCLCSLSQLRHPTHFSFLPPGEAEVDGARNKRSLSSLFFLLPFWTPLHRATKASLALIQVLIAWKALASGCSPFTTDIMDFTMIFPCSWPQKCCWSCCWSITVIALGLLLDIPLG